VHFLSGILTLATLTASVEVKKLAACDMNQVLHHRELATSHYKAGNLTLATKELQKTVALCQEDAFSHFMLANALYRENRLLEAKVSYQTVAKHRPGDLETRMSLGFTLFELGETTAATEEWLFAMRLDTTSAFARAALAVVLMATGDIDNALMQYEQAVTLDKRYADRKALSIDIRWKAPAIKILNQLSELYQKQEEKL